MISFCEENAILEAGLPDLNLPSKKPYKRKVQRTALRDMGIWWKVVSIASNPGR
jgi:hypothetical protein